MGQSDCVRDTGYALITPPILEEFNKASKNGDLVVFAQKHSKLVLQHLQRYCFACKMNVGKKVLNIGVGTGYGVEMLRQKNFEMTGLDISQGALSNARQFFPENNYVSGNCENMNMFESEQFDSVVAFEVLEHCWYPKVALKEIKRVMKENALFIGSMPVNTPHFMAEKAPKTTKSKLSVLDIETFIESHFAEIKWYWHRRGDLEEPVPINIEEKRNAIKNETANIVFLCRK